MMRIEKFVATNVHGYLNFDISFNDDVNFLYGLNGSGKTSALTLLVSLLEPDIKVLLRIPFESVEVLGRTALGLVKISASKGSDVLKIKHSQADSTFSIPIPPGEVQDDEPLNAEIYIHPAIAMIRSMKTPLFIDLNRKFHTSNLNPSKRRHAISLSQYQRNLAVSQRGRSLTDDCLREALDLVAEVTMLNREKRLRYESTLRKQVLSDAFELEENTSLEILSDIGKLRTKKDALLASLTNLGDFWEEFRGKAEHFFESMESMLKTKSDLENKKQSKDEENELNNVFVRLFLNQAQLVRIDRFLTLFEKHREQVATIEADLNKFISLINRFFEQTGKVISITQRGELKFEINGRSMTLKALSSGERQILVIMAQLTLNPENSDKEGIFIIDEPELSLHLSWQEMFVDAVLSASPNFQVIMATHSPAIIGGRNNYCVRIR